MPMKSRQPARPHFNSSSSFAISLPILPHPFFAKQKALVPEGTRAAASCFHPISYTCHQVYLKRFYQTLTLYREFPGRPTIASACQTQKCTSASYPCPLSLSGLALLSSDCLLFPSSFRYVYFITISKRCQVLFSLYEFPPISQSHQTSDLLFAPSEPHGCDRPRPRGADRSLPEDREPSHSPHRGPDDG